MKLVKYLRPIWLRITGITFAPEGPRTPPKWPVGMLRCTDAPESRVEEQKPYFLLLICYADSNISHLQKGKKKHFVANKNMVSVHLR